jgi:hypothetical protein
MVRRNKIVFGLLVLAIVCGVVAGLGAAQCMAQALVAGPVQYIVPNATCQFPACNNLIWGNPPTDGQGNPLPAGAVCTMAANNMWLCVQATGNCGATGMLPNGCPGTYTLPGQPNVFFACFQAINQC